jgi:hypothetical protein
VKRSGRDKPIRVAIHVCMEITRGISLYSYLFLKLAKTPCFSHYLLCVFFCKNRRTRGWNRFCPEAGGRRGITYVSKCKNNFKKSNDMIKEEIKRCPVNDYGHWPMYQITCPVQMDH